VSAALVLGPADRRWWLALAASVLVHVTVLSSPGWHVPTLDDLLGPDKEQHIEARLALPRAPVPAPTPAAAVPEPAAAQPQPVPQPRFRPSPAVSPAPTFAPAPAAIAAPAGNAADSTAPAVAKSAPSAPLPRRARIRFAVSHGDQGFVVGRAEHRLTLEGNAYTLRAVAETTGLVALFRSASVVQTSAGELAADGMRPKSFKVERGGTLGDMATFDWAAGRVAMSPGPRDSPAEPGMQDMLSMFYQLGLLPVSADGMALTVATGKKIERFVFALAGEEKIATPLGDKMALRLKTVATAGGDSTEVWIGVERRLPLRIRHVDRKGEIFDQVVDEMEIE
jgi:hypothetical protein